MTIHDTPAKAVGKTRAWLMSAGVAALLAAGAAQAAEAPEQTVRAPGAAIQTHNSDGAALEDIVVTARRQAERLLDVPLAITAFSQQDIKGFGITSLDAIAQQTPGLTFANYSGGFLPTPVVRGVSQVNLTDSEPNTAIFVDGVLVPARRALGFNQLDVERIEVVKGPQSALYGGNSFSGAINIVTIKPSDDFRASTEFTLGDNNRFASTLTVSGPLISGLLSGRLAVSQSDWDGSYRNVNPSGGGDVGGHNYKSVSGALRLKPTQNLDIIASAYYSRDALDERPQQAILANTEFDAAGKPLNWRGELPSLSGRDRRVLAGAIGDRRELKRGQINITWDTDYGTLTALTGYSWVSHYAVQDLARNGGDKSTPFVYQTAAGPSTFYTGLLQPNAPKETEDFSQELRFTTPVDRAVRGSLGVYYGKQHQKAGGGGVKAVDPAPSNSLGLYPRVPGVPFFISIGNGIFGAWFGPGDGLNPNEYSIDRAESLALFGHVEADLGHKLTGRIELRYTHEDRSFYDNLNGNRGQGDWDFVTPRFSLDYAASDDVLIYASAARGVKSGGFSSSTNTGTFIYRPYDPESNWSYEVGFKGAFANGRVTADLSAFYIDWTDIVLPQTDVSFTPPIVLKVNAGDAVSKGVEGSLRLSIIDGLTAVIGGSYTDAKFGRAQMDGFKNFAAFAPNGDISGQRLPRQSAVQLNGRLNWQRHAFGDVDYFIRPDASYQSKQYIGPDNDSWIPERTLVNLRTGLQSERYTLEFWATNLLNDRKPVAAYREVAFNNTINGTTSTTSTIFPWRYTVSYGDLRSVGATLRVRY